MKIFLQKAIFINRAPFDKMELDFNENDISVLSAINGKGKTTILSHVVDAFYELARKNFSNEFQGKENKFYRVSSSIYNLDKNKPSFVYLRFLIDDDGNFEKLDYLEARKNCTEEEYNESIVLNDKIPFSIFSQNLSKQDFVKIHSNNVNDEKIKNVFKSNLLTYFPAYRYEQPGYLTDSYKISLDFKKKSDFLGDLTNPIEVRSGLSQLANWIMDVILDNQYLNITKDDITNTLNFVSTENQISREGLPGLINFVTQLTISYKSEIQKSLNSIITETLAGKVSKLARFGIGPRNLGGTRIQIVDVESGNGIYPSIFDLSSGEAAILCLFGEILRQADNIKNNIMLNNVTGIVLIDEIDKHLHIKLQKEILPKLLKLFPNVQFITSSHSPFLSMGLAEELQDRSKIIDLDNLGISKDPTTNGLYKEVYEMMINENERFKERYEELEKKVREGGNPLIITEGPTDVKHIEKAMEKLDIRDLDIEFYKIPEKGFGSSQLKDLLDKISKFNIQSTRKVVGIFDRDELHIISEIEKDGQSFKKYGNDVYAFCIPIPETRKSYENISIEFYYSDTELKNTKDGKCLYFDNEVVFEQSASNKQIRQLTKLDNKKIDEENTKKIFDEDIGDLNWILSKGKFAELVKSDVSFIDGFNFYNFNLIFNKLREIINPSEEETNIDVEGEQQV